MGVRLYVGNLPPRLCFPELEDLFTPFGTISSAELMTDPATGRSRGFGFVEMATAEEARSAIGSLNGREVEGQTLTVNEAQTSSRGMFSQREERDRRPQRQGPSSAPSANGRLFVGNLPYTASAQDLEQLFADAGTVRSVSVVTDRMTGQSKGFAFVEMGSKDEAEAAIQNLNGKEALGRVLKVTEARPPERRFGGGRPFGGGRRY